MHARDCLRLLDRQYSDSPHPNTYDKMAEALTKKQQKALAFKSKQKAKRRGEINGEAEDVPEQDLIEDEATEEATTSKEADKKSIKPKAKEGEPESEKKQGKRKKTAWDEDEAEGGEEGADKPSKKSKKDVTQRFILFVGNLGFRTTKDRIEAVFRQALGRSFRLELSCNFDRMLTSSRGDTIRASVDQQGETRLNNGTHIARYRIHRIPKLDSSTTSSQTAS